MKYRVFITNFKFYLMFYIFDKQKMDFVKPNYKKYSLFLLFYTFSIILLSSLFYKDNLLFMIEKIPIMDFHKECTMENIERELIKHKIKHIDVVMAQVAIESSNLTSPIFIENNNMLGMKESKTRPSTCIGTNRNHGYYENWKDCIIDYALWQSAFGRNMTENQYIDYLDKIYAEDSSYGEKLRKKISHIRNNVKRN